MYSTRKLGNRHVCAKCKTAFYDFGKTDASCPKCQTPASEKLKATIHELTKKTKKPVVVEENYETEAEDIFEEEEDKYYIDNITPINRNE
jgi:hypothetical protein